MTISGCRRETRGRRLRRIDIHPDLGDVLTRLRRDNQSGHVFRALKGGALDPDKALRALKRDVIHPLSKLFPTPKGEIGFEHAGLHSFRRYFVTEAFAGGASEGDVRDWVGHRNSRIVERY